MAIVSHVKWFQGRVNHKGEEKSLVVRATSQKEVISILTKLGIESSPKEIKKHWSKTTQPPNSENLPSEALEKVIQPGVWSESQGRYQTVELN